MNISLVGLNSNYLTDLGDLGTLGLRLEARYESCLVTTGFEWLQLTVFLRLLHHGHLDLERGDIEL